MPVSDEFRLAFVHSAGIIEVCACGVTHFCSTRGGDFEPGELERLRHAVEHDDPKVVEQEDWPSRVEIGGKGWVVECSCGALERFEKIAWTVRRDLLDFIERRSKREAEELRAKAAERDQHAGTAAALREGLPE